MSAPETPEETELKALRKRIEQYRQLVSRLAIEGNKNAAWYTAKSWCPFWRELAFDLHDEAAQRAMLFE